MGRTSQTRTRGTNKAPSPQDRGAPEGSSASPETSTHLTFFKAALKVLETSEKPMTTRQIISEAIRRGLIDPRGKTPEATLSALFYLHVRDAAKPLIRRHANPGLTRAQRGSVAWSLQSHSAKRTR